MSIRARQLKSGRTVYDVRLEAPGGGQTSKRFGTKTEAVKWERSQLAARDRGEGVDLRAAAQLTVAQLAADFLDRPGIGARTLAGHRSTINRHILPTIGRHKVARVTKLDVQRLIARWSQDAKSSTVHRRFSVLRSMFGLALDMGMIARLPTERATLPPLRRTVRQLPTLDDVSRIAAALPPELAAMPVIAAYAGLRWGEVAGLQVADVNLRGERPTLTVARTVAELNRTVTINQPKRESARTFEIPRVVADALAEQMVRRGLTSADRQAWLFVSPRGGPLRYSQAYKRWRKATASVGLPGLQFHTLRSLNATLLIAGGADPKVVQHRLGHSDVAMTLRAYAQPTEQGDANAAALLDRLAATNLPRPPVGQ